jgi:hypothetical protein
MRLASSNEGGETGQRRNPGGNRRPKRSRGRVSAFVFALLAITTCSVAAGEASTSSQGTGQLPAVVRQFPLWSELPTRSFVILGEGAIAQRRWGIYAYRQANGERDHVCVQIVSLRYLAASRQLGVSTGSPSCGAVGGVHTSHPIIAEAEFDAVRAIVIGIVSPPEVEKLILTAEPGAERVRASKGLSKRRATMAHIARVAYLATAIRPGTCLNGVEGLDARGQVLFETPRRTCLAGSRVEVVM